MRVSFAGINARFHLVGAYTLASLLMAMVVSYVGDDPNKAGLGIAAGILCAGVIFGIQGVAYHYAAGREGPPSFAHYAAILFLPLIWLQFKLVLLTNVPAIFGSFAWFRLTNPEAPLEEWRSTTVFAIVPVVRLAFLILALHGTPICIRLRLHGERGAPIRQGLQVLRSRWHEGRWLVWLVLATAVLEGAAHYARGPDAEDLVPSIPEGLMLLLTSYLILVTFFGAARMASGLGMSPGAHPGEEGRSSKKDPP
jgi:hypothetical protein